MRLRFSADPVRHRCNYVGCDDEEGEVVFEEGGGEDDEEEADCEDLFIEKAISGLVLGGECVCCLTKERTMMVLRPAILAD